MTSEWLDNEVKSEMVDSVAKNKTQAGVLGGVALGYVCTNVLLQSTAINWT